MKNKTLTLCILGLLSGYTLLAQDVPRPGEGPLPVWAAINRPVTFPEGKPEVFGSYSNGCISGAVEIPESAPGWESVRPGRNRNFGHPELRAFLERLGDWAKEKGHGKILLGDVSQPCGCPMLSHHASHQLGLDVDIFFGFTPRTLSRQEKEEFKDKIVAEHKLEVLEGEKFQLKSALLPEWGPKHEALMREAAEQPGVDRIFITPPVKKALCEKYKSVDEKGTATYPAWLKKIRPFYQHQEHFHVRLACPASSPGCEPQKPIEIDPADTSQVGCAGKDLEQWFETDPAKEGFLKDAIESHLKKKGAPEPAVDWKAKEEKLPAKCKELVKLGLERNEKLRQAAQVGDENKDSATSAK